MDERPPLIIDKSFAQGAKRGLLRNLSSDYTIVITSSFYYETLSLLDESRKKIFVDFPSFRRVHTPNLYRQELQDKKPASTIHSSPLSINPKTISGDLQLSDSDLHCIDDFEQSVIIPQTRFWRDALLYGVYGFDQSDLKRVEGDIEALIKLCSRILDADFIRQVAFGLGSPIADIMTEDWISFRKLQTLLLHGLILKYHYPNPAFPRTDRDIEHDIHDLDYLILGLHARSFATDESTTDCRKLGWKYQFLCPNGHLLQNKKKAIQP